MAETYLLHNVRTDPHESRIFPDVEKYSLQEIERTDRAVGELEIQMLLRQGPFYNLLLAP